MPAPEAKSRFVTGHGFSRADKANRDNRALLAAEKLPELAETSS